jgi:hypothetical protein
VESQVCIIVYALCGRLGPGHTMIGLHKRLARNVSPGNDAPPGGNADLEHGERCMIGDFDGSANARALRTLYGKEAKSHDEDPVQTLTRKGNMDGVRLFTSCP